MLPAVFYFILKLKEIKNVFKALQPFILWGSGFMVSVSTVYMAAGGRETFLRHFQWITGKHPMNFAQAGTNIEARLHLIVLQITDTLTACDLPLLMMLLLSILLFMIRKNIMPMEKAKATKYFIIFLLLMLLSENIFYLQIVRSNYPRFVLPLLPFLCIFVFSLWKYMKRSYKLIFAAIICFQGAIAIQYLNSLHSDPRMMARKSSAQLSSVPCLSLAVDGAVIGKKYTVKENKMISITSMRSWAPGSFGIIAQNQKTIMLSPFDITMMSPDFIVTKADIGEEKIAILKRNHYEFLKKFEALKPIVFTLAPYSPDTLLLFAKRSPEYVYDEKFSAFIQYAFPEQLMRLTSCVSESMPTQRQTELPGKVLSPFSGKDMDKYIIYDNAFAFAFNAYETAGRLQDASSLGIYLLKTKKSDLLIKRALIFFLKHPEEATKNFLSIVKDGNNVRWDFLPMK